MFKFNNENIFVGYLKQLLASFNLPKYHVYTKEQQDYHNKYIEEQSKLALYTEQLNQIRTCIESEELPKIDYEELEIYFPETASLKARKNILRLKYKELDNKINTIKAMTPEKNVLISIIRNEPKKYATGDELNYPIDMKYIPYIKNNTIQIYAPKIVDGVIKYSDNDWKEIHADYANNHYKIHAKGANLGVPTTYRYNLKIRNITKNLIIQNNVYDSYTHEYLGDYLRFQRDYLRINLMPLYNCFSNRRCPKLDIDVQINSSLKSKFSTDDSRYTIYMVPIKLFQKYTIAMECPNDVEMCCGFYGQYPYDSKYNVIANSTYKCYNSMLFDKPVLFDITNKLLPYTVPNNDLDIQQYEKDFKLFIKVPATNKSSITILEGDYTNYSNPTLIRYSISPKTSIDVSTPQDKRLSIDNNSIALDSDYYTMQVNNKKLNISSNQDSDIYSIIYKNNQNLNIQYLSTIKNSTNSDGAILINNHAALNWDGDAAENLKHLITPLQLLSQNTGISYPFADRLIEYLVYNAITPIDEIADNIERAKKVINTKTNELKAVDGIWEEKLQTLIYSYMINHIERSYNSYDILGYVDKDVERLYSDGKTTDQETIASADIYNGSWED